MTVTECKFCKHTEFYTLSNGQLKCKKCRKRMTFSSRTNVSNLKMPIDKLKRLIALICENPQVSIKVICEKIEITYVTAQKKKQLIAAAIIETKSREPNEIFDRLLKTVSNENKKIEPIVAKRILSDEQLEEIKAARSKGETYVSLGNKYNIDNSQLSKIVRGKLYK